MCGVDVVPDLLIKGLRDCESVAIARSGAVDYDCTLFRCCIVAENCIERISVFRCFDSEHFVFLHNFGFFMTKLDFCCFGFVEGTSFFFLRFQVCLLNEQRSLALFQGGHFSVHPLKLVMFGSFDRSIDLCGTCLDLSQFLVDLVQSFLHNFALLSRSLLRRSSAFLALSSACLALSSDASSLSSALALTDVCS